MSETTRCPRYSDVCSEVVCHYGADVGSMSRCVGECFYLDVQADREATVAAPSGSESWPTDEAVRCAVAQAPCWCSREDDGVGGTTTLTNEECPRHVLYAALASRPAGAQAEGLPPAVEAALREQEAEAERLLTLRDDRLHRNPGQEAALERAANTILAVVRDVRAAASASAKQVSVAAEAVGTQVNREATLERVRRMLSSHGCGNWLDSTELDCLVHDCVDAVLENAEDATEDAAADGRDREGTR